MNGVEVVLGVRPAHRDELLARGLHVTGLVDCPALKQGRGTIPSPWETKSGQRFRQDGFIEAGPLPVAAAVRRHINRGDPAASRPGETRNLVEAVCRQTMS